jgi:katanin p60 ATPase-containing subunit A1
MVLAATNRPQDLDEAIRRRLEKRIYIPLPTAVGRRQLFEINLKGIPVDESVDWNQLVEMTDGYSGADLSNVCRDAAMMPLRRKISQGFDINMIADYQNEVKTPLVMQDFCDALKNV